MSPERTAELISRLHAAPLRGVLAVTGGGSGAISQLLGTPGASRTVLEAVVPYARPALDEWLGGSVDSACSERAARAMAVAAMQRACRLEGVEESDDLDRSADLFGLGCTASLASDRPKRGDHRLHVAVQTATATQCWSLKLEKGARSRAEEEAVAAELIVHALAHAAGLDDAAFEPADGDTLTVREKLAPPLWQAMLWGDGLTALIDPSQDRNDYTVKPRCERVLLPG
ncbi:MAG: hypothetical protein AAGJ46_18965, partial [Planctomycetota bacterium]